MKACNVYIPNYDWVVRVYIGVTPKYANEVLSLLDSIGCSRKNIRKVKDLLLNSRRNEGIMFSNYRERISVMVIEATSTPAEFLDSLVHECGHLAVHISTEAGIDLHAEEPCYIAGDFARTIYPAIKEYLCCQCNHR